MIQIQIKDPQLHVLSRQTTLRYPTFLYREIYNTAINLIREHWDIQNNVPIRALTVGVSHLGAADSMEEQLSLFDCVANASAYENRQSQEKLEKAIDAIRKKHGTSAISFGFLQQEDL